MYFIDLIIYKTIQITYFNNKYIIPTTTINPIIVFNILFSINNIGLEINNRKI